MIDGMRCEKCDATITLVGSKVWVDREAVMNCFPRGLGIHVPHLPDFKDPEQVELWLASCRE